MTATTPTTIRGVSILSRQKKRGQDVFELALSYDGIEVRRPGRPAQHMSWDRISEWEIEECEGYLLLTLRGQGATTPLVVPGWTLDDLEMLMRDATSGGTAHEPNMPERVGTENAGPPDAVVATVATSAMETSDPLQDAPASAPASEPLASGTPTRTPRKQRATNGKRHRRVTWRAPVTLVLLAVLATAVILVLLQSAGIIDWSFLGPVA